MVFDRYAIFKFQSLFKVFSSDCWLILSDRAQNLETSGPDDEI